MRTTLMSRREARKGRGAARLTWFLLLGLVVFPSGEAAAVFDPSSPDLFQVVYKSDDVEVATDLFDLTTFNLAQQNVQVSPPGTFSLSRFVTTDDWGEIRAGMFGYDGTYAYFVTTSGTAPRVVSSSWLAFRGAKENVLSYYGTLGSGPTVVGIPTTPGSYWYTMNSHATPGQYAGLNANFMDGEATLEALGTADGFVDLYLYKFQRVCRDNVVLVPGTTADYQAVLRLQSDGSTVLNPQQAVVSPVIDAIPDGTASEGVPYTGPTPTLSQGTLPVTWSLVAGPAGMTINSVTGVVSWPSPTSVGSPHTVTIRATNAGGFDEASFQLVVNPQAPSAPSLNSPQRGAEVDSRTPELSVNNAAAPGGRPLTYDFEVYADAGLSTLEASADSVPEGTNVTTWQVDVELADNAFHYWRSRACDGSLCSGWMSAASFFVNTQNDPPSAPVVSSPPDGSEVTVLQPVLQVTNATDPDHDVLTYEFEVYADQGMTSLVDSRTGVAQGAAGTTAWQVSTPLEEGSSYWWRARARDDQGAAGGWTDLSSFTVASADNQAPGAPSISGPVDGAEVQTQQPTLEVGNAQDPDGDVLGYFFEVDRVNTFDSIHLKQSPEIPEGAGGTTSWQPGVLADNTTWYWRVRASDGQAVSPWVSASFFVNLANDAPTVPTIQSPQDGAEVSTLTPTLVVNPSTDPDLDEITYEIQLYADSGMQTLIGSSPTGEPSWTVSPPLNDGGTYYWRARAVDEHGAAAGGASPWTALASFTVNVNGPPGAPTLNNPVSGGTVTSRTPTLSVNNAPSSGGSGLTYDFELYSDRGLTSLVASASVGEGTLITSWTVSVTLDDNAVYYWRARAKRGSLSSSWMPTAVFWVNTAGAATTVEIEASEEVLASASDTQRVEVTDAESPIHGVAVEIPPGALSEDATITIGLVTNPPALPNGVKALGRVIELGPSGILFEEPVTLYIPYTRADLQSAGVTDPAKLEIYTYSTSRLQWEKLTVSLVDDENKLLVVDVDHFSMFAKGITVSQNGGGGGSDDDSDDDSGGCGGCCSSGRALTSDGRQAGSPCAPSTSVTWLLLILSPLVLLRLLRRRRGPQSS